MRAALRHKSFGALIAVVAFASAAPAARASDDAGAAAETLFREGKRLMDAGDFAAACPKLAESQRLDPGNGTLARLASCHEKQGRTATAWSEFADLVTSAERAGQNDREKFARQHAASLQPQLGHLTLHVPADVAALPGLRIRRDAIDVGAAAWGVAVPVDPGEHHLEVSAAGRKPWAVIVTTGAGPGQREVTVPALEVIDGPAPETLPGVAPAAPSPASDLPLAHAAGSVQRTLGIAVGAAGLVGLSVGTYFGIRAMSDAGGAKDACPNTACSNAAGVQKNDDAKSNARLADVVLPLGLVGVVTGSLLYYLAPKGTRVEPLVGRVNGVRVETSW